MESLYFLVPIALVFVAIALRFLFWALNSGQYDNLDTEAHRILFDEDKVVDEAMNHPVAGATLCSDPEPTDKQHTAAMAARTETAND